MTDHMQNVPPEKAFWVADGTIIHNIFELAGALQHMKKETFKYHSNKQKNDFSEWIRDVIMDKALADELARTLSKDKAAAIVLKHIVNTKLK